MSATRIYLPRNDVNIPNLYMYNQNPVEREEQGGKGTAQEICPREGRCREKATPLLIIAP